MIPPFERYVLIIVIFLTFGILIFVREPKDLKLK